MAFGGLLNVWAVLLHPFFCRAGGQISRRPVFDLLLGRSDAAADHLAFDGLVFLHAEFPQNSFDPFPRKHPEQRVLQRDVLYEPALTRKTSGKVQDRLIMAWLQPPLRASAHCAAYPE